jgi:hypothetical protein
MLINEDRFAHSIQGRTYLADKGVRSMEEYKCIVRKSYGDLHGVKFAEYVRGSLFKPSASGHYWIPAAYPKNASMQLKLERTLEKPI